MRGSIGMLSLIGVFFSTACSDTPTQPPSDGGPTFAAGAASRPSLNLYGIGGFSRAVPRSPCAEGAYRQFDFWIGKWDVFNPAGTFVGTNVITNELDGCLIFEHWIGSGGVRGLSINTYDAETGQWHQTWVTGNTLGHVRLAGGLVNSEMVMTGVRQSVFGFPLFNEATWTPLGPDRVRQVFTLRIPAINLVNTFDGTYERVDVVTPVTEQQTTDCTPTGISAETRRLDFLIGEWSVETEHGRLLGHSSVETAVSDCAFVERFTTRKGYEAVSFTYWDRVVGMWYRTYIDSEGERLELSGLFDGDRLVLQGTDGVPGGAAEIRLTLAPAGEGVVEQTFEISRDAGATWQPPLTLRFVQ